MNHELLERSILPAADLIQPYCHAAYCCAARLRFIHQAVADQALPTDRGQAGCSTAAPPLHDNVP